MGHQNPVVVEYLHAFGRLEVRIEFGVANLPYVDTGKAGEPFWEATLGPQCQSADTKRHHASRDDLGAAVAVRPKADRILDETVGRPSQQETSGHKCRGHERRR